MSAEVHSPLKIIAHINSDFPEKFGIPRQSGLAPDTFARIIFEKEYRSPEALRGIEGFDYLWLIWDFSESHRENWSPTVRPPRLGGNSRLGVFATRSPFRPNSLGLSSVRLEKIEQDPENGPVLVVSGADLMDGTPIYDIKPYIPYTDSHPEAAGGFAFEPDKTLKVVFPQEYLLQIPEKYHKGLIQILSQDPRPSYRTDGEHIYGLFYAEYNIRFQVQNCILTVCGIENREN